MSETLEAILPAPKKRRSRKVAPPPVRAAYDPTVKLACQRGRFDEILNAGDLKPREIIASFTAILPETFVEFDKKNRGDALNLDLYGWCPSQEVAVIQIRHAYCRYKNGYMNVHKDYVLVGRNEETGELFRHPISAHAIRAAIKADRENAAAAVHGAQRWMWSVTEAQRVQALTAGQRQGDVLLVRDVTPSADKIDQEMPDNVIVGESHRIQADRIVRLVSGRIIALNPRMEHVKNQHAHVYPDTEGWYSVRVANTASTWEWGERIGD
jgi:hypothetical protein